MSLQGQVVALGHMPGVRTGHTGSSHPDLISIGGFSERPAVFAPEAAVVDQLISPQLAAGVIGQPLAKTE